MAVLLLAYRSFKRNGLLRNSQNIAHLVNGHSELGRNVLGRGILAVAVEQHIAGLFDLVDCFNHVDGNTDCSALVGNGSCYRLPYPPGGVG